MNSTTVPPRHYPAPVVRVQIVKEQTLFTETKRIRSPRDVAAIVAPLVEGDEREHFFALLLDQKNGVKAVQIVAIGDLSSCIAHPREIFRSAVVMGAASIIVAHNHPSGDPTPSPEDIATTRRLHEAGQLLGIDLLDHVGIGDGRFTSIKETGGF